MSLPVLTVLDWAWSIAKLIVDGLLDPSKSAEQVMSEAAIEVAAFKATQAREDEQTKLKFPDYEP